jgi:hypothetical protein
MVTKKEIQEEAVLIKKSDILKIQQQLQEMKFREVANLMMFFQDKLDHLQSEKDKITEQKRLEREALKKGGGVVRDIDPDNPSAPEPAEDIKEECHH